MYEDIITILKMCSLFLLISSYNFVKYVLLIRRIRSLLAEKGGTILETVHMQQLSFVAFMKPPEESGDEELDVLLFKTHLAVKYGLGFLLFFFCSSMFFFIVKNVIFN